LGVLRYPALKLDDARRAEAQARFDRCITLLDGAAAGDVGAALASVDVGPRSALPRCRDPDDQKFLELAAASGASFLFSRDAEVLRLRRRTLRDGLFAIVKPEDWAGVR
jgi:predicted nucleic acid-binding protein